MNRIVAALLFLASGSLSAAPHCEPVKSKGEGHWPVPEEAFTKANAQTANERLAGLVNNADDEDIEIVGDTCALHNASIMVKGYVLKRALERETEAKYKKYLQGAFCKFIVEEAYTCH